MEEKQQWDEASGRDWRTNTGRLSVETRSTRCWKPTRLFLWFCREGFSTTWSEFLLVQPHDQHLFWFYHTEPSRDVWSSTASTVSGILPSVQLQKPSLISLIPLISLISLTSIWNRPWTWSIQIPGNLLAWWATSLDGQPVSLSAEQWTDQNISQHLASSFSWRAKINRQSMCNNCTILSASCSLGAET